MEHYNEKQGTVNFVFCTSAGFPTVYRKGKLSYEERKFYLIQRKLN